MRLKQQLLSGSILALLLPGAGYSLPADPPPMPPTEKQGQGRPLPVITVEAAYPGADAQVVADTVAAPIEQQVNGVEGMRRLVSRSTDGGRCTLHIHFAPRTDLAVAQLLVLNRVHLALPLLPETVQQAGVAVRAYSPRVLLLVTLLSPDTSRDTLYLSNYATIYVEDELSRLAGVGKVSRFGICDYGLRIWLDPDRLAVRNLTVADVIRALREQNVPVEAGKTGQPPTPPGRAFSYTITNLGRLVSAQELADTVVKTGAGGRLVRLKDVAKVELAATPSAGFASLDGKPVVALGVFPTARANVHEVSAAVRDRMQEIKRAFPPGIDYTLAMDLARPEGRGGPVLPTYLSAELVLPPSLSAEAARRRVERCGEVLMHPPGVRHVLALSENPFARFGDGPCLLGLLAPANRESGGHERVTQAIRTRLEQVEGIGVRLRDPLVSDGYPVDLAVRGPDDEAVKNLGEQVVERLGWTGKLTDLSVGPKAATKRQLAVDVDRATAAAQGVAVADISTILQAYLGSILVTDLNCFGRIWPVEVAIAPPARHLPEDLKRLKVRNALGKMIPLSNLVKLRERTSPGYIDRLDLQPMAEITANPAPGVSLAEARWLCETLAEEVRKDLRLSPAYGLVWLRDMPVPKPAPGGLKPTAADAAPPEVGVSRPAVRMVTDYEDFTGRLQAVASVEVRARVTGHLEKAHLKEGGEVKAGDLLFQIDPRPYQADLDLAEADLKLAEAELSLQERVLARARQMVAKNVAKEELDQHVAAVHKARATVAARKAARERARLFLDWTRVTARITGRISRRFVDPGNLVNADTTLLTTIVSTDPMYAVFDLDERTALRLMQLARDEKVKAFQEAQTPVSLGLAGEEGFPWRGILNFVDNQVDADTGTLRCRAVFANADSVLLPGAFVRIRLPVGAPKQALLVPEEAIGTDERQKFLYVLDDQNKVTYRRVRLGPAQDGLRVIAEGLKPGERVVVSGLPRLKPGMAVKPHEVALPDRTPSAPP